MKWTEQEPKEGDTIKVEFNNWTGLGTQIGVFLRFFDGRMIIDFGRTRKYLDRYTSVLVHSK